MKVLHVIPQKTTISKNYFLGVTKDIAGRQEYFRSRRISVEELIVKDLSDSGLLPLVKVRDMNGYSFVLLEYPLFPHTIRWMKKKYPHLKVIVRGSNAAWLQWLHFAHARLMVMSDILGAVREIVYSFKRLYADVRCARLADYVISVCDWETDHYWSRLTPRVRTAPYYLPKIYRQSITTKRKREMRCVCLLSTKVSMVPFLRDAVDSLSRLVEQTSTEITEWSFIVSGEYPETIKQKRGRIRFCGFVENPLLLLQTSRALVLLSDYGFGFKTKILEAIYCGCYVLVTKKLFERIPTELHPYCLIVDRESPNTFIDALITARKPFPKGDPNTALQHTAWKALDSIFYETR